jgi:NH3-dependent NAD+ synthetase
MLGIPEKIAYKASSPQLYPGHKATDEIPIDYEKLDPIEALPFDRRMAAENVADEVGVRLGLYLRSYAGLKQRDTSANIRQWSRAGRVSLRRSLVREARG